jgi:hypothetical protein
MIDQSLKIAVDPFFGANEQQYLMNQEFVATEVKYSMVFEETVERIKDTPSREMHEAYYSPQARMEENENEGKILQPEAADTEALVIAPIEELSLSESLN